MIDGTESLDCGRRAGSVRGRADGTGVLGGPAARFTAASLVVCGLICVLPPRVLGETITRRHLDAGRVEFTGLDLNGDGIPDAITQDNIKRTTTCYFADARRSLKLVDPLSLPDEERRLIPDMLAELDLDGDEVRDLLLYNRDYFGKYADNETVFVRLLGSAVYIGQAKDTYRDLNSSPLTPEARRTVVEKAREIVLKNRQ